MTKAEEQNPKSNNSEQKSNKSRLPWWVEILFVQIGLPESLLRDILKTKNKTSAHIAKYKTNYYLSMLIIASFVYINPIIKYSTNSNNCVRETLNYLTKNNKYKANSITQKKLMAINYCNGGDYLVFD